MKQCAKRPKTVASLPVTCFLSVHTFAASRFGSQPNRRLAVVRRNELTASRLVGLQPGRSILAVHESTIRRAAMSHIKRHRGETLTVVRLPFVNPTIAVRVLFDPTQRVVCVVLEAIRLSIPSCRDFDLDYCAG